MSKAYDVFREEVKADQENKEYEEIKEEMFRKSKHAIELDNLQPQNHLWVDRGAVMSCEFAGHPNHRAFKIKR